MKSSANHLLAEFDQCSAELLDDQERLCAIVEQGVRRSGFGLLGVHSHRFEPIGVTVIALISESHIAVHTYPEAEHASIDIFSCSPDHSKTLSLLSYLRESMTPSHARIVEVQRGDVLELYRPGWVTLTSSDGLDVKLQVQEKLFSGYTPYQKVEVLRSAQFGKMLVIDNDLQIAENDSRLYNEQLVAPLISQGCSLENVLILGGGDGGAAREVLRHDPGKITIVDIDREIVDICERFLPELSDGALADSRVRVVCEDARDFLDHSEMFDAVIYDLTMHPEAFISMPREEYLSDLFERIGKRSKKGGVITLQIGSSLENSTRELIEDLLSPGYTDIMFSAVYIPSFCGQWVFGSAVVG